MIPAIISFVVFAVVLTDGLLHRARARRLDALARALGCAPRGPGEPIELFESRIARRAVLRR